MIIPNDVIKGVRGERLYRVISLDHEQNRAWLMRLEDNSAWPEPLNLQSLFARAQAGDIQSVKGHNRGTPDEPSDKAILRRDFRWALIEPLVNNPEILIPHRRCALVRMRAQSEHVSPHTIYTALRAYWQGGLSKNSLLPRFHACSSKEGPTGNRGRKPSLLNRAIYQITEKDIADITRIGKQLYAKHETMPIKAAYQRYIEKHHTYADGNLDKQILEDGQKPTLKQFTRVLKASLDIETIHRGKFGDKSFERTGRGKTGSVGIDAKYIGDYYEIDATIADVFLVSSLNPHYLIGKPTLYLVFDRFSRLIVGFHVSLGAASWDTARAALASIAMDKEALCNRYGLPYNAADWPADGVFPRALLADRGELLSKNSNVVIDGLEITVANLPSERPDHKPIVECGFKQIHAPFREGAPGYQPPENIGKRRTKNYEKGASLTLDDFTKVILCAIIAHNKKALKSYAMTPQQLADNLVPTPINIWNNNLVRHSGALRRFDEEVVRRALLPRDEARVTVEGIYFKGLYYTCHKARSEGWFTKARKKAFPVAVSYDPRSVNTLLIHGLDNGEFAVEASLLPKSADFGDLSFSEVSAMLQDHKRLLAEAERTNQQLQFELHQHIDPDFQEAANAVKAAGKGSLRSRTAKKQEYRKLEEERIAQEDSSSPSLPLALEPEPPPSEVVSFPPLRPIPAIPSPPLESPEEKRQRLRKEALNAH